MTVGSVRRLILPDILINGRPFPQEFPVQVLITNGRAPESSPYRFGASVCGEMQNRIVDEATALSGSGEPIYGIDRDVRQNDTDAFVHSNEV